MTSDNFELPFLDNDLELEKMTPFQNLANQGFLIVAKLIV